MEKLNFQTGTQKIEELNKKAESSISEENKNNYIEQIDNINSQLDQLEVDLGFNRDPDPEELEKIVKFYENLNQDQLTKEISENAPDDIKKEVEAGNVAKVKGWIRGLGDMKKLRMAVCLLMLTTVGTSAFAAGGQVESSVKIGDQLSGDGDNPEAEKIKEMIKNVDSNADLDSASEEILKSFQSNDKWDGEKIDKDDPRVLNIDLNELNKDKEGIEKALVVNFSDKLQDRFENEGPMFLQDMFDEINADRETEEKIKYLIISEIMNQGEDISGEVIRLASDEGGYVLIGTDYPDNGKNFADKDEIKKGIIEAFKSVL